MSLLEMFNYLLNLDFYLADVHFNVFQIIIFTVGVSLLVRILKGGTD